MKDRSAWEKRLKGLKNYKKSHKESEDFGSKLPDSRYEAIIGGAKLADSQKGKPQIVVSCRVVDDEEYSDVVQPVFMGLNDVAEKEDGRAPLSFTLNTLKRLGFELSGEDATEIVDAVEELNSSKMRIKLRVNNGYANIDGPSDDSGSDDDEAAEEKSDKSRRGKDVSSKEDDEGEEAEEETEEVEETKSEVTEGVKVSWDSNGEEKTGTVIEILEDDNIARVEKEDGKISRVPIDKLTVVAEEATKEDEEENEDEKEEEEVEEKPKRTAKKKKVSRR